MGLIKSAADLTYTFRFIRMLVMDWKNWDAYKLGIIDENGKRQKSTKLDSDEKKSAYTPFIRLCANIKRLVSSVPGGGSKLGSFASALYLIKEKYEVSIESCDLKITSLKDKIKRWEEIQDKIQENQKIDSMLIKADVRLDDLDIHKLI